MLICNTGDFCHAIQCNFRHPDVTHFEMQFIKHGGFQYQLFSLLSRCAAFVYKRMTLSEYGTSQIVGLVPLTLSRVFHLFLKAHVHPSSFACFFFCFGCYLPNDNFRLGAFKTRRTNLSGSDW